VVATRLAAAALIAVLTAVNFGRVASFVYVFLPHRFFRIKADFFWCHAPLVLEKSTVKWENKSKKTQSELCLVYAAGSWATPTKHLAGSWATI
jgi:hypothetical protein